jgi:hypothetical protein
VANLLPKCANVYITPPNTPPRSGTTRIASNSTPNRSLPFERSPPPIRSTRCSGLTPSLYEIRDDELSSGILRLCDGREFTVNKLASGSYHTAFSIDETVNKVIPGRNNSNIIVKALHKKCMGQNYGRTLSNMRSLFKHSLKQYHWLKSLGLPVAEIYNNPEQDGFVLIERMKRPIHNVQKIIDPKQTYKEQTPLAQFVIDQVATFIAVEIATNTIMDCKPDNCALREDGTLVLFDYLEEEQDADDTLFWVQDQIKLWAAGNPNIEAYLSTILQEGKKEPSLNRNEFKSESIG